MAEETIFAFDSIMTKNMKLEVNNTQVIQTTDDYNDRNYMSPCVPTDSVSSVTIKWLAEGKEKNGFLFGISKEHFANGKYLGELK